MPRLLTIVLCLFAFAAPLAAHEGHDHEDQKANAPAAVQLPRMEVTGDGLELVAVSAGHDLTIYLDKSDTNEPIDGATISVVADGGETAAARPAGQGTYMAEAHWAEAPGTKAVKFTITHDGKTVSLDGKLEIPAPAEDADAGHAHALSDLFESPIAWLALGFAAVIGFVVAFAFRPARLALLIGFCILAANNTPAKAEPNDGHKHTEGGATHSHDDHKHTEGDGHNHDDHKHTEGATHSHDDHKHTEGDGHSHDDHNHGEGTSHSHDHHHDESSTTKMPPLLGVGPHALSDGDVFMPKPSQRLLNIRTRVAVIEKARETRELIGKVVPDPSSFGQVQAPMDGRIELTQRGISHIGEHVKAGDVLALLYPNIPIADLGTMQQLTAEVVGKLRIAEQKLARLTRISGVVPQKDIDDTRAELEALREQQRVLAPKDAERIELKAPVDGVISVANVRAGQVVTTRDTLFEIVDPNKLWIEAIGVSAHPSPEISNAHAVDPDGHTIKLSYIGRAPSLRQQSLSLQFKVDEIHEGLIIGSAVKVFVEQGEAVEGVVVPSDAVVRGTSGLLQVWVKTGAEVFRPVPVRTLPLDGTRVLVVAGLEDGDRVAVQGAEFINQVR
ncbi:hypothetical protein DLM45_01810 [Hyphomicrobium methylovorum]|uniref:HlyD family efflux transporter periplasmic adaptor subunit n=1 Tax=Hyphomicrobium methylovorum TaxID=84 RepID=UPI0015E71AAE|nr:HlyD family efflux transporter periplasmic adaptor subunit [Hyphomicrobium methylovorum]MBA2124962.1 hypothetical protein [Hyphomicrobium methylovorum]